MNERTELAEIISEHYHAANPRPTILDGHIAETILAAGYRKPRTVATAAELDALRTGSVVLTTKRTPGFPWRKGPAGWRSGLADPAVTDAELIEHYGPVTVLHEGGAMTDDEATWADIQKAIDNAMEGEPWQ